MCICQEEEKISVWLISVYTASDGSYFVSVSGRETLEDHSQLCKKANKCSVGAVASFSYVWRDSMSASSPHRESTDSLILSAYNTHVH